MNSASKLIGISTLGLSSWLIPAAFGATIYNVDNFQTVTQANPFTYGTYTTVVVDGAGLADQFDTTSFSEFTRYRDEDTTASDPSTELQVWDNGGSDPNVIYNPTGATEDLASILTLNSHKLTMGPYMGPTVVRFTVPTTTYYNIDATYTDVETVNTPPDVYVYENGVRLYGAANSDATPGHYANNPAIPLLLTAGTTIDFVAYGDNVNNKTVQLDATLTTVPEPALAPCWQSQVQDQ